MFEKISIMRVASLMARHATQGQSVISQNIANSDTPNYKASDIAKFSDSLKLHRLDSGIRVTRSTHISPVTQRESLWNVLETNSVTNPNGNSVSIEDQMLKSIEVERQHSRALTIYQHSVDLLKMSIGRGR